MGYGVDIGATSLKVVSVSRSIRGYKVIGAARRRLPKATPEEHKVAVIKLLLQSVGSSNGQRPGVVGLSGRDINLQVVQQPQMKRLNYRVMMGYELEQRRGEATDLYLDYVTLREPDAFFPQYLALVGIGKSAYVDERIDILRRAAFDVRDAVPNPFALYAAHRSAYGAEGGVVLLLDIGADNMDLAFVRGGRLIFARNVSSGGRIFDTNIANMCGVSGDEAESLKIKLGNLGASATEEEGVASQVRAALRSGAGQLAGFITSSINHAKLQLNDRELVVDKVYVSGGGARLRGLPEYLAGSLKIAVELFDPFKGLDTGPVESAGGHDVRQLPTDLAIAVGLAQLASPASDTVALSILPDKVKKRKAFLRSSLWLGVAAGLLAATLVLLTALAVVRKGVHEGELARFREKTEKISQRIEEMDKIEAEQCEVSAKTGMLLSHLAAPRGLLDAVSKLKKPGVTPAGVNFKELRLADVPGRKDDRGVDRQIAYLIVKSRGLVWGEVEAEKEGEIKLKGQDPIAFPADVVGEVRRVPSAARGVLLSGEVDENMRGGHRAALNQVRDQLTDRSRGVTAEIRRVGGSPDNKSGWKTFEILLTFE